MAEHSPILDNQEEERKQQNVLVLDALEQEHFSLVVQRIIRARNQREEIRDEFDGLSYEQAYLLNKRASYSYLVPKKNDNEVRINTGTTEKRIEFVLNELLALNVGEEVNAYDEDDNRLQALGETFTDIVKRTEQMEQAEEKDIWTYLELLTQPSVFVEEIERIDNSKSAKKGFTTNIRCERRLIEGLRIYLGDIHLPDYRFQDQPFICKYTRMTYEEGRRMFSHLDRWKYVKRGSYDAQFRPGYDIYRKNSILADEIEIWEYMDAQDREYQITINGIPMHQPGEDLPWKWAGYNMEMVGLKPYSNDFAYSKPLTASSKTLQALNNETIRNLIRKFRQALEPPIGIIGNKTFNRDIWEPGTVTQGIKKDDFQRLIDHQGVTQSELAMFDLIEKKTNEFTGTNQMAPLQGKTQTTATEFVLAQREAVKMLGLSVLAVMRLKQKLAMLRIKNILTVYTKPNGKEIDPITKKLHATYARFTLNDTELQGGKSGTKVIQLMDRGLSEEETSAMFDEEQKLAKQGKNVEFKVLNAKKLKELNLYFYVNPVPRQKESNELDKAMFNDKLRQGQVITAITGMPMKKSKLVDSFERIWKERDFFEREVPQVPGMMQGGQQPPQELPEGIQGLQPPQQQRPSINTLTQ